MGALRGSISYTKFYVLGDVPEDFRTSFIAAIQARVVEPLKHDSDDEQHHGWCAVDKPFSLEVDQFTVLANEYLNVGMRIDRWRLQVPLLKSKIEEAEANYRARTQRSRLGKQQRAEIKTIVVRQLRKQTIPVTKSYDVSWNTNEKVLRLWSKSFKVIELFADLFEKTFKLKLIQETPVTTATHSGFLLDDNDYRFYGSEFLTWLWYESEGNDGNFDNEATGPFALWFEDAITLEADAVRKEKSTLKGAAPSSTQEAKEALRRGKVPLSARIRIEVGPHQFACVLTSDTGMSSVAIPALIKDDPEEKFYERMYLIENFEKYISSLYSEFMKLRLSPAWADAHVPALVRWINDDGVDESRIERRRRILKAAKVPE